MTEYDIDEVLEYAEDLRAQNTSKDNIDEFNQAIMRLADAVQNIHVVDCFGEIIET